MASDDRANVFSRFGRTVPPGTILFREGDPAAEMYIIQSGRVRISKTIRGAEKTLAVLEKGEFLGEMAILNDRPRSASAEALEKCEMLVIDRQGFESLLRSDVGIAIRFIRRLSERLRETNDQLEALMIKDNTSRVASILAKRVRHADPIALSITVDELGALAGLDPEVCRLIVEKLAHAGLVDLSGGEQVRIGSPDQVDRLLRYLEMREMFGEIV